MTIAALPSHFFSLQLQLFLPARQPATLALQRQSREVLGMGMGKEMARAQGMAVKHRCRQALTLTKRSILAQVPVQSQVRCSKGSEVNLAACKRR